MDPVAPISPEGRVESIDVLRGFAVLGILLMNIVSFGLPFGAYVNPSVNGGAEGANLTFWLTSQTLFEGKMRAIFSMLFGASALLLIGRREARGAGLEAADIYYRRTMWLIVFGLLHAHLIWFGDILYAYGVAGLLLFPLRKLSARALIITAAVIIAIHSMQGVGAMIGIREMSEKAGKARKAAEDGNKPAYEESQALKEWTNIREMFLPSPEEIDREIKAHRGGWVEAFKFRAGIAALFEFTMFFQFMFLDVLGMLVLGMGLAKAGVFDARRSYGFYAAMVILGFGLGAPLNYWAGKMWIATGFAIPEWFGYLGTTADAGRFLVASAYIGLIMLVCKAGVLGWLRYLLASTGRMALTNYLLTSVLCTFVFDGLGLFAKLERAELLWVVFAVWAVILIISPIWLRHFRYGPAEWAWRALTYWEKQPMVRARYGSIDAVAASQGTAQ